MFEDDRGDTVTFSCPSLEELPPPPAGRVGWPWTNSCPMLVGSAPDGRPWPRITIITPSLNQAEFIEETIRSVLLQGYPNLEFMVLDGGSTDGSADIVAKYQEWLAYSSSEKDRGQSSAINKGLRRATGAIFNWINSDDALLPGALRAIGETHLCSPGSLLAGDVVYRDENQASHVSMSQSNVALVPMVEFWTNRASFHQPGIFIPLRLLKDVGLLDENLHYAFDHELYCRLLQITTVEDVRRPVALYRIHSTAKSIAKQHLFLAEVLASSRRHWERVEGLRFPAFDEHGAGIILQVGLWQLVHGRRDGLTLVRDAIRTDFLGAAVSTILYFPGWIGRAVSRRLQRQSSRQAGSISS